MQERTVDARAVSSSRAGVPRWAGRHPVAAPMLAAAIAVLFFVLLRIVLAGDGDPSKLVVAGSAWADATKVPSSLSRDLTEIVSITMLVAGMLAMRRAPGLETAAASTS